MVKGNSRQVILVNSPDQKIFEQAIFILKDEAVSQGITDDQLLKEAKRILHSSGHAGKRRRLWYQGPLWAAAGALITGAIWLISVVF